MHPPCQLTKARQERAASSEPFDEVELESLPWPVQISGNSEVTIFEQQIPAILITSDPG